jgi:predicted NUDIX family phosphoesterase
VHLGIVHYWALDGPNVNKREQMITQMAFMSSAELGEVRDSLETWSGLCVDHLAEIENHRKSALEAGAFTKDK